MLVISSILKLCKAESYSDFFKNWNSLLQNLQVILRQPPYNFNRIIFLSKGLKITTVELSSKIDGSFYVNPLKTNQIIFLNKLLKLELHQLSWVPNWSRIYSIESFSHDYFHFSMPYLCLLCSDWFQEWFSTYKSSVLPLFSE